MRQIIIGRLHIRLFSTWVWGKASFASGWCGFNLGRLEIVWQCK